MPTKTVCNTCERTENTCGCDFATTRTPEQKAHHDLYANATVPVRHTNDRPFSMRTFRSTMSDLLTANPDLFV
jgi:hypothetical protein